MKTLGAKTTKGAKLNTPYLQIKLVKKIE